MDAWAKALVLIGAACWSKAAYRKRGAVQIHLYKSLKSAYSWADPLQNHAPIVLIGDYFAYRGGVRGVGLRIVFVAMLRFSKRKQAMLNLTPHAITLRTPHGDVTFPPSGQVARVSSISAETELVVAGVPVIRTTYGPVQGLVYGDDGLLVPCLVSGMVLGRLPSGTLNAYAPATGPNDAPVRENGQVVAVTKLLAA